MRCIALIPARYGARRLPAKALARIGPHSLIQHCYLSTVASAAFDAVAVVTDHPLIAAEIERCNGSVYLDQEPYPCGCDRIAAAVEKYSLAADVVVNVQGDQPQVAPATLRALLARFAQPAVSLASAMTALPSAHNQRDIVKVVTGYQQQALYFSRAAIPCDGPSFRHIGIYAFRRQSLLDFAKLPRGMLEQQESIECLRWLEHGRRLDMVLVDHPAMSIDNAADLAAARQQLADETDD